MSEQEKKTIEDLREHMFAVIAGLREGTVSVEQAKAVAELGHVIVNSAKVEADVMKATRHKGSGFIPELPAPPGMPRLVSPMGNK